MCCFSKVNILSYMTTLHSYSSILIQKQHTILHFSLPYFQYSYYLSFTYFRLHLHILQQQTQFYQTLHGVHFSLYMCYSTINLLLFHHQTIFLSLSLLVTSGHGNILHYTNSVLQVKQGNVSLCDKVLILIFHLIYKQHKF